MADPRQSAGVFRFGSYEADVGNRQLRRGGLNVRLQGQPFEILALLLEHAGNLVTHEQLRARLWSAGTVVEFDHSVHTAVTKLREALGDDADNPRFVATVPRHGYRFIAPVSTPASSAPAEQARRAAVPPSWLVPAVVVAVTLGLAYVLYDEVLVAQHARPNAPAAAAGSATPAIATHATPVTEKSVAVLPFVDISEKGDQEYFSDGLSEELIDMLTKVPDLQVPARTSSFYFKGKQASLADIAKMLGVAHVLEGSVRKSGKNLRVTARLIRVDNGYHVWSETYDRRLDDVFKVQEEIARAVVKALRISLRAGEGPHATPTKSTDVYTLLLQARFFYARSTPDGVKKSVDYYQQAVRLDPDSAPAWAGLSRALGALPYVRGALCQQIREQAIDAAERARTLDPGLAEARWALGKIRYYCDWNWAAAESEFKDAMALDPHDQGAVQWAGIVAMTLGRLSDALQLFRQAAALDPVDWSAQQSLYIAYFNMGRFAEAETAARKMVELAPTTAFMHGSLGQLLVARGAAVAGLAEIERETNPRARDAVRAWAYQSLGRKADADAALAHLEATQAESNAYGIATLYAMRGEADRAFAWLDRAYRQHELVLFIAVKYDSNLNNIRGDPRYKALLHKMKLPE